MMSGPHNKRDDDAMMRRSITSHIGYDFKNPDVLLPQQIRRSETGEPDQASNKRKRPIVARILTDLNRWGNVILVSSCVIAVVMDPLFFYIPYVDEEKRCLGVDEKVKDAALVFRSVTDIPRLSNVDEKVLEMMCDYLKKVSYRENTLVFQRGEPIDRMIFITEGSMWSYTSATESSHFQKGTGPLPSFPSISITTNELTNGDCYGDVLLQFASSSPRALPTSVDNVRCNTKVEAFVLMANDLRNIITRSKELWLSSTPPAADGCENSR